MAKIKIKLQESEIEIDSRDFYIDNVSANTVIAEMAQLMQCSFARPTAHTDTDRGMTAQPTALIRYADDEEPMTDTGQPLAPSGNTQTAAQHVFKGRPAADYTKSLQLDCLVPIDNAEVDDPEPAKHVPPAAPPTSHIGLDEIRHRIEALAGDSFFETPRTVSDTVAMLRRRGYVAASLDVSKTLAKMAISGRVHRQTRNDRNHYSVPLVASQ